MESAVHGFYKGMNKDSAKNKYDPNMYEHANNWRIMTDEGLSSGSLVNEKGHTLSFKIPDIEEMTLDNGDVIAAQANLKIIGLGTLLNKIIVFTTNEDSDAPVSSIGQIWVCNYDESTNTIEDLDVSGYLTVADHLKYNNALNFSNYHTIKSVIGRYENANTQRVYWTDNYNPVRVFNIADANSLNIDIGLIDLASDAYLSQPVPLDIITGSLPTGTTIQFSYRLLGENGAQTIFAPCSVLYPLSKTSIHTANYWDFEGDGIPTNASDNVAAVKYYIKDVDTNYKYIEHIAILYTRPNIYTVYKFKEDIISSSGYIEVVCDDLTDAQIITNVEFNMVSSGFNVAKCLEVKNRRLIAANTKTTNFDLDFDARAYRFDNSQIARVYNSDNSYIEIDATVSPDYSLVPEEHDAINIYNDEQDSNWSTHQYLYQADGTTIGGSGPNISYSFTTHAMPLDFNVTGVTYDSPHVRTSKWSSTITYEDLGVTHLDGSLKQINRADQYSNNASAYNPSFYRGYARGEVYRFGIVFYNKKGSPSFVKWIGDIKFPEPQDGFPIQDYISGIPDKPYGFSLGITFNVDISSIEDQISAFEIVRVERTPENQTRLGSGGLMFFDPKSGTNSLYERWNDDNGFGLSYTTSRSISIYGVKETVYHVHDRLGFAENAAGLFDTEKDRITWLLSPIGQFFDFQFKQGDYTKTTGYYRSKAMRYHASAGGSPTEEDEKTFGFYYKALGFKAHTPANGYATTEWFQLFNSRSINVGEYILPNTDIITNPYTYSPITTDEYGLANCSYARQIGADDGTPLALGSKKLAMIYAQASDITLTNNDGDPAGNWQWEDGGAFYSNTWTGDIEDQDSWFKEVLYCRPAVSQYGGNTYVDRGKNRYMSCGHHQLVNGSTYDFDLYGGDVFVNYYDDEYLTWYNDRGDAYKDPYNDPAVNKLSVAGVIGCETYINYNYRWHKRWASHRDATNMTSFNIADSNYNLNFSQDNNTEAKFYAKDAIRDFSEEQPHRLWASEPKIDGELIDSWRQFKSNNITEVNGVHGPINRIINYRDRLYFYQDKAFGIASIDDQSVITDESGQTMILGTGGVFPNYAYISVNTGVMHQLAVCATEQALYHFDARLKKFYKYTEGLTPLSDVKGMNSYFNKNIDGSIRDTDLLTIEDSIGIVSTPDFRYNRVLFTFLNHKAPLSVPDLDETINYKKGDILLYDGVYYEFINNQSFTNTGVIDIGKLDVKELLNYNHGFTISYNEITDSFESFYDYRPYLYLNTGSRLLSVNPFETFEVYEHDVGDYGSYYGRFELPSELNLILADKGLMTKIFTNIAYKSEMYDTNNNDVYNETFNQIRFMNEYQDTGIIDLDTSNIKRRIRTWHYTVPRDKNEHLSRIRNPWVELYLKYDNNLNKRYVLHEVIYNYIISEY